MWKGGRCIATVFALRTELSDGPNILGILSSTEEEVLTTRLIEKAIRKSEAVDRESLCILAGEKVRLVPSLVQSGSRIG